MSTTSGREIEGGIGIGEAARGAVGIIHVTTYRALEDVAGVEVPLVRVAGPE